MKQFSKKSNLSWLELFKSIWFLTGLSKVRGKFFLYVVLLFLIYGYSLVPPLIIGKIVDFFSTYKTNESLTPFYLYAAILSLSFAIVAIIRLSLKKALGKIRNQIKYSIKVVGFEKLVSVNLNQGKKETVGENIQKIQKGTEAFHSFSHLLSSTLLGGLATIIGAITIFAFLGAEYILFVIGYVVVFFIIVSYFSKRLTFLNYKTNKLLEKASGSFVEGLSNILSIKAGGAEDSFKDHISGKEKNGLDYQNKSLKTGINQWKTYQVFFSVSTFIYLLLIARSFIGGQISLGDIVVFYAYLEKIESSSNLMLSMYSELIKSKVGIIRLNDIFNKNISDPNKTENFPKNWKEIQIKNGNFEYKSKKDKRNNLKNINLSIKKNQKIGIVGKTGSGKSTLAKILKGLLSLDSGSFLIGGKNFYRIKAEEINKNIAIVLQDTEMFNLSLKQNITLLRRIDPKIYKKAIKISSLQEVIDELPDGENTIIGEKGYYLSGGQRQRIAIARAICKNAQILIFDEATSALDFKTEAKIQGYLEKELTQKTLIFIAHRTATLKKTNSIIIFKNGKIIETDSFKALLKNKKSEFQKLYNKC